MRIVIPSANTSSWLIPACVWLLNKHWSQHPPILIGGYDKPANLPVNVEWFTIGRWSDYPVNKWSDGLIRLLESIPDEHIIYTMDDFLVNQDIDHDMIVRLWEWMLANPNVARMDLTDDRVKSGGAIQWGSMIYPRDHRVGGGYGEVSLVETPPAVGYQLSFQTAIWNKARLLKYLVPGETPAQSEISGSRRMSLGGEVVMGTKEAPISYLIGIQHGKVTLDGPGYQAEGTRLLPEDRAELEALGYLTKP